MSRTGALGDHVEHGITFQDVWSPQLNPALSFLSGLLHPPAWPLATQGPPRATVPCLDYRCCPPALPAHLPKPYAPLRVSLRLRGLSLVSSRPSAHLRGAMTSLNLENDISPCSDHVEIYGRGTAPPTPTPCTCTHCPLRGQYCYSPGGAASRPFHLACPCPRPRTKIVAFRVPIISRAVISLVQ